MLMVLLDLVIRMLSRGFCCITILPWIRHLILQCFDKFVENDGEDSSSRGTNPFLPKSVNVTSLVDIDLQYIQCS